MLQCCQRTCVVSSRKLWPCRCGRFLVRSHQVPEDGRARGIGNAKLLRGLGGKLHACEAWLPKTAQRPLCNRLQRQQLLWRWRVGPAREPQRCSIRAMEQCLGRNFGAVIVLSAANFPRYEVFEPGPDMASSDVPTRLESCTVAFRAYSCCAFLRAPPAPDAFV